MAEGGVEYSPLKSDGKIKRVVGLKKYCAMHDLLYFKEGLLPVDALSAGNLGKYLSIYSFMVSSLVHVVGKEQEGEQEGKQKGEGKHEGKKEEGQKGKPRLEDIAELFHEVDLDDAVLSLVEHHISYLLDCVKSVDSSLYERVNEEFSGLRKKLEPMVFDFVEQERECEETRKFNYVGDDVSAEEERRRRIEVLREGEARGENEKKWQKGKRCRRKLKNGEEEGKRLLKKEVREEEVVEG